MGAYCDLLSPFIMLESHHRFIAPDGGINPTARQIDVLVTRAARDVEAHVVGCKNAALSVIADDENTAVQELQQKIALLN